MVLRATAAALDEVRYELRAGHSGSAASVTNVDHAAEVLHEQAEELRPVVNRLIELRNALSEEIAALG